MNNSVQYTSAMDELAPSQKSSTHHTNVFSVSERETANTSQNTSKHCKLEIVGLWLILNI